MGAPKNKGYKRSWKNLLLNKRYQLRFTLFMVGLSAVLMGVLGWWVNREAKKATTIFLNMVQECPRPPVLVTGDDEAPAPAVVPDPGASGAVAPDVAPDDGEAPAEPATGDKPDEATAKKYSDEEIAKLVGSEAAQVGTMMGEEPGDEAGEGGGEAGERPRRSVAVTTSEMTIERRVNPNFVERTVKSHACHMEQSAQKEALFAGQRLILYVMVVVGLMLILGLTIYGIKMTHKVAGPLHKISLYFAKMRDGKYDTVWNLRKGDHLVEFYDHFKGAHAGLKKVQEEDIAELQAVLEAADKADLASKSPELAAMIDEMRTMLARKEESIV